jgi:hypothetical protein
MACGAILDRLSRAAFFPTQPPSRPRGPNGKGERRGAISFRATTRPKNSEKRNERFAMRNETKRIPGRKSLESLSALNQSFRGIVCFQLVNRLFVSRFFILPVARRP